MLLLTDTESLEVVVRHGLNPKVIPTIPFREVLSWSQAYYQQSLVAPTIAVLHERFGTDLFSDHQINLDEDVEEAIEWAIADLEGTFVQQQIGQFVRDLATSINSAAPEDRVNVLGEKASVLSGMVLDLQPRITHMDIRESGPDLLAEYEQAANAEGVRGMCTGLTEIDTHLGGIWPGELAVVGGPAGTGKSFFADLVAYNEWSRGRVTTIYTLENSILMNQMRIACCALNVSIEELQTGTLSEDDHTRLVEWCNDVLVKSETPLNIISPDLVNRSPQALIQQARAYETESLIIDQLTHIQSVDPMNHDKRNEEVAKIVRAMTDLINTGRERLPCLMLHQINREGIKAADSSGRLHMTHFAESSAIERDATWAASLYQSEENRRIGRMELQSLKTRRVQPKHWLMSWQPWQGLVHVIEEVDFSDVL